jgi:CheY-like chemotaxis protein
MEGTEGCRRGFERCTKERITMKILVVDDEPMQLKSMRMGLRTEGHLVVTALSAEEALELMNAEPGFDLIITDYLMPGMSGLGLLKAIRETKSATPVILMTACRRKGLADEVLRNQGSGFLDKPFSLDQLLSEIASVQDEMSHMGGRPHHVDII